MPLTPGQILAAGTSSGSIETIWTGTQASPVVDLHVDVVTAATVSVSITPVGGSAVALYASKTIAAGAHAVFSGIRLGVGDLLRLTAASDSTYYVMLSPGSQPGLQVTGITGSQTTSNVTGTRFQASWIQTNTTGTAQDCVFFIATAACKVIAISEIHAVAAGGTSTMQVTKDTSTNAPGAGTDLLATAFDLNATANTVQAGSLIPTAASLLLAAGDRLAVDWANAVQSSTVLAVTATLEWV